MDLQEFGLGHEGIAIITRRHFDYEPLLEGNVTQGGGFGGLGALNYTRFLDPAKLGLSLKGVEDAIRQGELLAEMEIIPSVIICGLDQRNYDGARFSAAAIMRKAGKEVKFFTSPAVTYPHYRDPEQLSQVIKIYGDMMVHMYLAGRPEVDRLWSEARKVFHDRIVTAIWGNYPDEYPILFDLNFEQIVLLYYTEFLGTDLDDIPIANGWLPTKGGGLVWGVDGEVREFRPDLTIVE